MDDLNERRLRDKLKKERIARGEIEKSDNDDDSDDSEEGEGGEGGGGGGDKIEKNGELSNNKVQGKGKIKGKGKVNKKGKERNKLGVDDEKEAVKRGRRKMNIDNSDENDFASAFIDDSSEVEVEVEVAKEVVSGRRQSRSSISSNHPDSMPKEEKNKNKNKGEGADIKNIVEEKKKQIEIEILDSDAESSVQSNSSESSDEGGGGHESSEDEKKKKKEKEKIDSIHNDLKIKKKTEMITKLKNAEKKASTNSATEAVGRTAAESKVEIETTGGGDKGKNNMKKRRVVDSDSDEDIFSETFPKDLNITSKQRDLEGDREGDESEGEDGDDDGKEGLKQKKVLDDDLEVKPSSVTFLPLPLSLPPPPLSSLPTSTSSHTHTTTTLSPTPPSHQFTDRIIRKRQIIDSDDDDENDKNNSKGGKKNVATVNEMNKENNGKNTKRSHLSDLSSTLPTSTSTSTSTTTSSLQRGRPSNSSREEGGRVNKSTNENGKSNNRILMISRTNGEENVIAKGRKTPIGAPVSMGEKGSLSGVGTGTGVGAGIGKGQVNNTISKIKVSRERADDSPMIIEKAVEDNRRERREQNKTLTTTTTTATTTSTPTHSMNGVANTMDITSDEVKRFWTCGSCTFSNDSYTDSRKCCMCDVRRQGASKRTGSLSVTSGESKDEGGGGGGSREVGRELGSEEKVRNEVKEGDRTMIVVEEKEETGESMDVNDFNQDPDRKEASMKRKLGDSLASLSTHVSTYPGKSVLSISGNHIENENENEKENENKIVNDNYCGDNSGRTGVSTDRKEDGGNVRSSFSSTTIAQHQQQQQQQAKRRSLAIPR